MNNMKTKIVFISLILLLGTGWYLFARSHREPPEKLTFAISPQTMNALPIIAIRQNYFLDEGLDLAIQEYPTGRRSLEAMLAGEADVSTTAGTPIIFNTFKREPFKIFVSVGDTNNEFKIVARKNANIKMPKDLIGKRIATQESSDMHFFLYEFLKLNGLGDGSVNISFKKAERLAPSLAAQEVDVISTREPFITETKKLLGEENVIIFSEPQATTHEFFVTALDSTLKEHPKTAPKMIRALLRAEKFAKENPAQAISIVATALKIDRSIIASRWPDLNLRVSLQNSTLLELKSQGNWAIEHDLTTQKKLPDYLSYFDFKPLTEVKPEAISVIR